MGPRVPPTPDNPDGLVVVNKSVDCPYCHTNIPVGTAGLPNYYKRHKSSDKCDKNLKKHEKESALKKLQKSAAAIFGVRRAPPVPPTVKPPPQLHADPPTTEEATTGITTPGASTTPPSASNHSPERLNQLRARIKELPSDTNGERPDLDELDRPLSRFYGNLVGCVREGEDAWEKWDQPLNVALQRSPKDLSELVRLEGKVGLTHLCNFMEYLIRECGVPEVLLEGKIERLTQAVISVSMPLCDDPPRLCLGVVVKLPPGTSPHSAYPFALHEQLGDPWDYSVCNGIMSLRSRACTPSQLIPGTHWCRSCQQLEEGQHMEKIVNRMVIGVHENAPLAYHGVGTLIKIIRQKNNRLNVFRMRKLNDARKLVRTARTLEVHRQWIMAVGSGKVERVDRLVRSGLNAKKGIRALLRSYDDAAQKVYRPRNYTEADKLRGLLLWRLGGARVAEIAYRALDLPSISTLRRNTLIPRLQTSPYTPTLAEIEANVGSCFEHLWAQIKDKRVVHQVIMIDELKVEERPRWCDKTNMIVGVCREHADSASLEFVSNHEPEQLLDKIEAGTVHLATEATVAAIGLLTNNAKLYTAWPIVISGTCRRENAVTHAGLLQTILQGSKATKIRTVSIASDGESKRGQALVLETFKQPLSSASPIYSLLSLLPLMNLEVGKDDITADKDYRHIFKCSRNLLLRKRGIKIHGSHIMPISIIQHLRANNVKDKRLHNLTNPSDKQDVKLAYDLLSAIWSLPLAPESSPPLYTKARNGLRTLGKLFYHLLLPYICIDLSLSEQLVHLSAAAHLLLALAREENAGALLIPTQLYINIMIMIKNAFFCVAKCKKDDPAGQFWLILLGTDRVEEIFGITRTMVGNDCNVDVLQLSLRLTGTTEVSTILAQHPEWDRTPRRLRLPSLSKDTLEVHDRVDHIRPNSWRGDVCVANVSLQSCWQRGCETIKEEIPHLAPILDEIATNPSVNILRPFGKDIVRSKRAQEDYDDTAEDYEETAAAASQPTSTPVSAPEPDFEDAMAEELATKHQPCFMLDGHEVYKGRYLNKLFRDFSDPNSRDRTKRVANQKRYTSIPNYCEDQLFVAIGEVNNIIYDSKTKEELHVNKLADPSTTISFQLLHLTSATVDDDPKLEHDWKWSLKSGTTFQTSGKYIEPINPTVLTRSEETTYLFESKALMALGASILERLVLKEDGPKLPGIDKPTNEFPYRKEGKACFLCERENERGILLSKQCPSCTPPVPLENGPQLLAHMAAHHLYDPRVSRSSQPCGFCLRPGVDHVRSSCPMLSKFSYAAAAKSSATSPSSNVPVKCPECPESAPAVWKYNMFEHIKERHSYLDISNPAISTQWEICGSEKLLLKDVWNKRHSHGQRKKKEDRAPLVISEAHSTSLTLQ
ncbi:hypothetical protein BDN72DRAFT_950059 [Pluteus cervinus]|uniref:Uncharacterized protein n=1 Tax=Pluteus cervinus TaxID=181527 RepID=A0ACD2ZYT8_9AGAR|nr:hypothetical protein BDN72DRAFT_950059 [Pluteus cervinus]